VLLNIFKYMQLALAGVAIVEQTFAQDAGASKKQKALDLINNEAQLIGVGFPNQAQLAGSIVNMAVAAFNIAGLFSHKPAAPAQ
jgi:hypothetical protein